MPQQATLYVFMYVLSLYRLYVRGILRHGGRGGGGEEDSLQLKNGKSGWVHTLYISKVGLSHYLKKNNRIVSAAVIPTSIAACLLNKISIYLKNK